jgi:putative membrane protein
MESNGGGCLSYAAIRRNPTSRGAAVAEHRAIACQQLSRSGGTVMKCTGFCILTALSAFVLAGAARAESDAEYANPGPASASAVARAPEQAKPKPRPAVRAAMFAPAAAANAKRMSAQQREERRFLKEAAAGSRFEAEAARMALGKSSDPGVRSLAATLINYHASANNELLHMLHGRGMAAPMLANDQRKVLNRLGKLHGTRFDREFVEQVALKHQQEDVKIYEKASLVVQEPRLRAWIIRTLPTLRYHLATAERIAPADIKLARPAADAQAAAATGNRLVGRASAATRSMGAGPEPRGGGLQSGGLQFGGTQSGGMVFGGAAQLGITRPIAARPSESSNR